MLQHGEFREIEVPPRPPRASRPAPGPAPRPAPRSSVARPPTPAPASKGHRGMRPRQGPTVPTQRAANYRSAQKPQARQRDRSGVYSCPSDHRYRGSDPCWTERNTSGGAGRRPTRGEGLRCEGRPRCTTGRASSRRRRGNSPSTGCCTGPEPEHGAMTWWRSATRCVGGDGACAPWRTWTRRRAGSLVIASCRATPMRVRAPYPSRVAARTTSPKRCRMRTACWLGPMAYGPPRCRRRALGRRRRLWRLSASSRGAGRRATGSWPRLVAT